MTNKEAINMLVRLKDRINFEVTDSQGKMDALNMAIKALEQEPCEDAVSRQAVIDALHRNFASGFEVDRYWNSTIVLYAINEVPSVNPQKIGYWIIVDDTKMKCSNCDIINLIAQYPRIGINYCPSCGAKMSEIPTGSESEEEK